VFISGGSSGIGKATAKLMVEGGAKVMIAARGEQRLAEAADDLQRIARTGSCKSLVLDIADPEAVKEAATEVLKQLGGLDILINNAGLAHPGYVQSIPDDVFDTMMQVNYFGTVRLTRAFLPHMIERRSGQICNVSSLVGYLGIFGYSAYAASKFAICGFSDCLRQELLPYGIGVSLVFPPDTDTPQLQEENRIKPVETKAIAGNVKALRADEVASAIASGLEARRYHIVPGASNKFTYFMYRHFPWVVRYVMDNDLKRVRPAAKRKDGPQSQQPSSQ
jgi:3-dehydrosphinganine reductase